MRPQVLIRPAIALTAGALAAFAHPPWGFLPGLIGYGLLLALLDATSGPKRLRRAFGLGWLMGFSYFLVGCWWVDEAFQVDVRQAWMGPFAACLLPMGLALFWGAAAALWRKIAPAHLGRVLVFAGVFCLFEWLRGHLLTGFPWNLPGETWAAGRAVSQMAAYVGAYGLSFLTVLAFAAFAPLLATGSLKRRSGMAFLGAAIVLFMWSAGAIRLHGAVSHPTSTVVRIVQADVPQEAKWSEARYRDIISRYLNLTSRAADKTPNIVIWPEGALPDSADHILDPNDWIAPALAQALAPNQTLLMGTIRVQKSAHARTRYFNSLYAIRHTGAALEVLGTYDKHRLVPFGEYLPLESILTPLGFKDLTHIADSFSAGPPPRPLSLKGVPRFQTLICYESLFPGLAQDGPGRPAWIVNISNDAWFGPTSGPRQHLNIASYRAIEQGVPIVRATPTGVSAVVDAWGRVLPDARLNPGESGVIDVALPAPTSPTVYSWVGDTLFWCMILLSLVLAVRPRVFSKIT